MLFYVKNTLIRKNVLYLQKKIIMGNYKGKVFEKFSQDEMNEIFHEICDAVVDNNTSFKKEIANRGISLTVFNKILMSDPSFKDTYMATRMARADYLFEEIIEIADTPIIGDEITIEDVDGEIVKTITKRVDQYRHRQIQIDARKWSAQRMNPFKYGDKIDITSDNKAINQVTIFQIPDDGRNSKND